jgi:hypothetical protein
MLTSDVVESLPTKTLSDLVTAFEGFGALLADLTDMEGFVVELEGGLQGAVHIIDAELQRRPAVTL